MKRSTKAPDMDVMDVTSDNMGAASAPKMASLLGFLSNGGGGFDSQEGEKYVTTIKEYFEKVNIVGNKVNVLWHSGMPGLLSIECNNQVIMLLFASFFGNVGEQNPKTMMFKEAMNTYTNTVSSNHEFLSFIIVTPTDYPKVKIMIQNIENIFIVQNRPEFKTFDIVTFADSGYIISTSGKDVIEKLDMYYPHGVLPRADFGFCMYKRPQKDQQLFGSDQFFSARQSRDFIGLVTGYTEILNMSNPLVSDQQRFAPIVHLSAVIPVIPDLSIMALLLPVATGLFLRHGLWTKSIKHFTKDNPNIGRLFNDPADGSLCFVDNETQYNSIVAKYFERPIIVLDVVEGTYKVPGMEKFAMDDQQNALLEVFSKFIRQSFPVNGISSFMHHEYIGTVMKNNQYLDSRWCDYLHTIIHHESDANTVKKLLIGSNDPKLRVMTQKELYPNLNILYSNMICPVNMDYMDMVQGVINRHISVTTQGLPGMDGGLINLEQFIQAGRQYHQGPGVGFGQTASMFGGNPFTQLY